jgi:hypothetical protein
MPMRLKSGKGRVVVRNPDNSIGNLYILKYLLGKWDQISYADRLEALTFKNH